MAKLKPWTDEASALGRQIVIIQDRLTASLGLALRGIAKQHYKITIILLPTIRRDAAFLEEWAQELGDHSPGKRRPGRPPKWFEVADDVYYLARWVQRRIDEIERDDIPGGYWKLIKTKLESCQRNCQEVQRQLKANLGPGEQTSLVDAVADIIETLDMGQPTQNGWRRNNK